MKNHTPTQSVISGRKKPSAAVFLILLLLSVTALSISSFVQPQQSGPEDYRTLWAKTDSLEKKGLRKSALDVVMQICTRAKQDGDIQQLIKGMIYRLKFTSFLSEEAFTENLNQIDNEISQATFPENAILQSIRSDLLWNYYTQNRYEILNRSVISGSASGTNPLLWDARRFVNECTQSYSQSLHDAALLKKIPLEQFDEILLKGNNAESRKLRPTLYDFLAHRALDFYKDEEPGLTQPAKQFQLNSAFYLNTADMFLNFILTTPDTGNFHFKAIRLFQDLTAFHYRDSHPGALIDLELERLKFVLENSIVATKDSLYKVALQSIASKYSDYPGSTEALYALALRNRQEGEEYSPFDHPVNRWKNADALKDCNLAISGFPYSYGASMCRVLKKEIESEAIHLVCEETNLPNQPLRARLQYKNVSQVFFRLYRAVDPDLELSTDRELFTRNLLKQEPLRAWNVVLQADSDYQFHAVEIPLNKCPSGFFVLICSTTEKFSPDHSPVASTDFSVSNMALLFRTLSGGDMAFYVTDRKTGSPLRGVTAELITKEFDYSRRTYTGKKEAEYLSDNEGRFLVSRAGGGYRNFFLRLTCKGDTLESMSPFFQSRGNPETETVEAHSYFFTDRSIYRPGQIIYFKGILLNTRAGQSEIVAGRKSGVKLYDVNNNMVAELQLVSNAFGTINGSFTAPQGTLSGIMRIADENGSTTIRVEEYKRPKFQVQIQAPAGNYKAGSAVSFYGSATSFSGQPVAGAEVRVRAERTVSFPVWGTWRIPYYRGAGPQQIYNDVFHTNDTGGFSFTMNLMPDPLAEIKEHPVFNYVIYAEVIDQNGESHTETRTINAGYDPYTLNIPVPDNVNLKTTTVIPVISENYAGQKTRSTGTVTIREITEPQRLLRKRLWARCDRHLYSEKEYVDLFPSDVYDNEDDFLFRPTGKAVYTGNFDTGKDSLLDISHIGWRPGHYLISATSISSGGDTILFSKVITVFNSESSVVPTNTVDFFSIISDNVLPGNSDEILIGSSATIRVLYEIEKKGKITGSKWLDINKGNRKIEIPVTDEDRGNFTVHFSFVYDSRIYTHSALLHVPWTNKELQVQYEVFRDKLVPGTKEHFRLRLTDDKNRPVKAEVLAGMYDASLDMFAEHNWKLPAFFEYGKSPGIQSRSFGTRGSFLLPGNRQGEDKMPEPRTYDQLNWFGFRFSNRMYKYAVSEGAVPVAMDGTTDAEAAFTSEVSDMAGEKPGENLQKEPVSAIEKAPTQVRTNLKETAFFYPALTTDDSGFVSIDFTSPEAITGWRLMIMAHTQSLQYVISGKNLATSKPLMLVPNPPRFVTAGDTLMLPVKIVRSESAIRDGMIRLEFFDGINGAACDEKVHNANPEKRFRIDQGNSTTVFWEIIVPADIPLLRFRVTAGSGNFTDGEEQNLPVLPGRLLVTETLPIWANGPGVKEFQFDAFKKHSGNLTGSNSYTLEYSVNPVWYAVQALPYLMEASYDCMEQVFSRYYSNAIAYHIAQSQPEIQNVFESWKSTGGNAFMSNLEKNQDLKSVMLEETPWVIDARDEKSRKERLGILFDRNHMEQEMGAALERLTSAQTVNGGWPWFPGMPEDRFITQYIIEGFGHLEKMQVIPVQRRQQVQTMVEKGMQFLDAEAAREYSQIINSPQGKQGGISHAALHYLYCRSYFPEINLPGSYLEAYNYFQKQASENWTGNDFFNQGMAAMILFRSGNKTVSSDIIQSLREHAQHDPEKGMYWKTDPGGWRWWEMPVETQALLVECFYEITGNTPEIRDMLTWLLRQKQTTNWKSTKATAEACYALLIAGKNWLGARPEAEIKIGGKVVDINAADSEPGTGYFRENWTPAEITADMSEIKIITRGTNAPPAWGGVYWQHFEDAENIAENQGDLSVRKKYFIEKISDTGPVITPLEKGNSLKPGDRVRVQLEITCDRDFEYVHLKDLRAAGLEPAGDVSGYRFSGGLGYYQSTRDASENFFLSYLTKGTHLIEYSMKIYQAGSFSAGPASIQCMYAPAFSSHSEGTKLYISD
ncbi:MAG: hypothetical protein IT242_05745 [Bacteroidia bacterium]|nr:hypothetical protein [Bacteroidia bacterium]